MKPTISYVLSVMLSLIAMVDVASAQSAGGSSSAAGRPIAARDLVGVNRPSRVEISPDGKWLTYYLSKADLERNERRDELWLVRTTGADKPRLLPSWPNYAWSLDSKSIAFVTPKLDEIRLLRVGDMTETVLTKKGDWKEGFEDLELSSIGALQWSPDGKSIAFLLDTTQKRAPVQEVPKPEAWRSVEMDVAPVVPVGERPANVLCVLDVASGRVRRLTDRSLGLGGFAPGPRFHWSPNSTQLVFAAAEMDPLGRPFRGTESGLYVVDKATGKLKTLFKMINESAVGPIWSPDGKWITFQYDPDISLSNNGRIAIISPEGGEPRVLTDDEIGNVGPQFWSPDSKEIYFGVIYKLRFHYFRVSLEGKLTKVTPDDGNYRNFSLSRQGDTLAFEYANVTEPPEIYVSSLSLSSRRKLTDLNPQLKGLALPKFETLKWRSEDNRWDIHGILVKPVDYVEGRKYPLMVCVKGGPGAVSHGFGADTYMAVLAFAARGYLVLVPSNRPRPGFGRDFQLELRKIQKSAYGPPALGDVTSGAEELVRRGMADPERVGWMGWSYGATLGAYALTRTNRFKAAWLGDPTMVDESLLFLMIQSGVPGDQGLPKPLTAEDIERKLKNAAIYHMYNVKTPALLECGGKSHTMSPTMMTGITSSCMIYFQAMRSFRVPSELHVFKEEGHGWRQPLQWEESYNRQLEWLDYWVRGIATERMAKRYGQPKNPPDNTALAGKSPGH